MDTHTHAYRRANQGNFKKPGVHGRRPGVRDLLPCAPGLKVPKQDEQVNSLHI